MIVTSKPKLEKLLKINNDDYFIFQHIEQTVQKVVKPYVQKVPNTDKVPADDFLDIVLTILKDHAIDTDEYHFYYAAFCMIPLFLGLDSNYTHVKNNIFSKYLMIIFLKYI